MKIQRIILHGIIFAMLFGGAANAQDDDSVPYIPYPIEPPQRIQQSEQAQPQAPAPAKQSTTTKKKTSSSKTRRTTKKTSVKKPAPKKKAAVPKKSSLERGIELINAERYEAAKPYLLKAIQENKNDPNAWYWYGVYHDKTGGFYQAQYFYSKALAIDPAFEPLSRVVYYPEDPEKTPLWDPKRPAQVYRVEVADNGMGLTPANNLPSAPNDPEFPKVPVYTPPAPGTSPLDGDAWQPGVYVPPAPEELESPAGVTPVYTPPQAPGEYTVEIPGYSLTYDNNNGQPQQNYRAPLPVYNPPAPKQNQIIQAPQPVRQTQPAPTVNKTVTKTEEPQKKTAPRRIVKQSEKKKTVRQKPKAPAKQPAKKKTEPTPPAQPKQEAKPQQTQAQRPRQQAQPQQQRVQPQVTPPPVRVQQEQPRPRTEYLPPLGQQQPDPGTILENSIPPVGQGQ